MNKLALWRRGEKITAKKLNDAVITVNELIQAENNRLDAAAKGDSDGSSQYNAVPNFSETVPAWYQDITPVWNQDGEVVIYDEWDYNGSFTSAGGVYGREVGINAIRQTEYKEDCLRYLLSECEVQAGQQVVQEITIDSEGKISENKISIYDTVSDIPAADLQPDGTSKLYRRLSRIIEDNTHASCGSMTMQSAAWLYKAVATNDFTLSPITVNATGETKETCKETKDSGSGDEGTTKEQVVQLVKQKGIFSKVKGIENKGGLAFCNTDKVLGIKSGIELYSQPLPSDASSTPKWEDVKCSIEPKGGKVVIAKFPISKKHYEWDSDSKDYKETLREEDKYLEIIAEPVSQCNSWQWGFAYGGQLDFESYKYTPDSSQLGVNAGEGIIIEDGDKQVTISRNLFLELGEPPCASAPSNALTIHECKENNNKVTYKMYAPQYEFDPSYFTVTAGGLVSLNRVALECATKAALCELSVEVTATGIIETTYSGSLRTDTSGTLSLNSNIHY